MDARKGVGILMVMMVHSLLNLGAYHWILVGNMALFFVGAGYTYKPASTFTEEVKKKSKRLLIPYFVYGILTLLLCSATEMFRGEFFTMGWRFVGLLYSRFTVLVCGGDEGIPMLGKLGNPALWFLTALYGSILLTWIYTKSKHKKLLLITYLAVSAALTFSPVLMPWSLDTVPCFAVLVVWGMRRKYFCSNFWKWALALAVFYTIVRFNNWDQISVRKYGNLGVFSIPFFLILGVLKTEIIGAALRWKEDTKFVRSLAWLGRNSLSAMCLHMPIIDKIQPIKDRIGIPEQYGTWVVFFVTLVICCILMYGIRRMEPRYPFLRWL